PAHLPAHVRDPAGSGDEQHPRSVLMISRRRTRRVRCAVVEDDPFASDLVTEHLELAGFDVASYADGRQALDAIVTDPPDICVLDIDLPGLDGISVLQQLRSHRVASGVIMLTARAEDVDRVR